MVCIGIFMVFPELYRTYTGLLRKYFYEIGTVVKSKFQSNFFHTAIRIGQHSFGSQHDFILNHPTHAQASCRLYRLIQIDRRNTQFVGIVTRTMAFRQILIQQFQKMQGMGNIAIPHSSVVTAQRGCLRKDMHDGQCQIHLDISGKRLAGIFMRLANMEYNCFNS